MRGIFLVLLSILTLETGGSLLVGQDFCGKVVGVADGDTITVLRGTDQVKVRLEGIDCPENGADFSAKAKRFTSALLFGKAVTVRFKELDKYGRSVGRVFVGTTDSSLALVRAGLAWHYKYYSNDLELAEAEEVAKAAEIGVWSLPNPIPPWEERHQKSFSSVSSETTEIATKALLLGNPKSHIYHGPSCRYYGCKNCTVRFESKQAAEAAGYVACSKCQGN